MTHREVYPFTVEAIPGFNVTVWPKWDGKQLHATRVMVVSMDPAHPVDGTVLRRIAIGRILRERFG